MPLPAIAIALAATEISITAEELYLAAAGGSILLIGLQPQIDTYLNNNRIKEYRSVSPQEIITKSYQHVLVFISLGQTIQQFSRQLEIEWVKREYLK